MFYRSTRGGTRDVPFEDAVLMGLAEDGGLLVPDDIPRVGDRLADWKDLSYPELASQIFQLYAPDLGRSHWDRLTAHSYNSLSYGGPVAPLREMGPDHLLELFHGPTLAFKDVALQLLGNLFEDILARRGGSLNIVAATSGDTGSAAIYGVRGKPSLSIFVMHPRGKVAFLQERQMTTVLDENVHNLAVEGSFDDCQHLLKGLFRDLDFKHRYHLGAVNSVNWCRVMAQIVYYFYVGLRLPAPLRFCVPSGNFGNFLAAWYAREMGLPIETLIVATNENDILARYFATGLYARGTVHHTLAPAMDIQVASNFERYLYYREGDRLPARMEEFERTGALQLDPPDGVRAGLATRADVLETVARVHREHNLVLDPHTAVAVSVGRRTGLEGVVYVATAHPAKFPEAFREATGHPVEHPRLEALRDLPTRCTDLPNDLGALRSFVERAL